MNYTDLFSFNQRIAAGKVAKNVKVSQLQNNNTLVSFAIPTIDVKKVNNKYEHTYHYNNVKLFNATDYLIKNIVPGAQVLVVGIHKEANYKKDNEEKSYNYIECTSSDVKILSLAESNGNSSNNNNNYNNNNNNKHNTLSINELIVNSDDDDIPF